MMMMAVVTACGSETVAEVLNQPAPEIVGATSRSGSPGLDYTVWIDCTVRNNGDTGEITLVAELRNGEFWRKREVISLSADTERLVTFAFPEATVLRAGLSGYKYSCTAG